MVLADLAPGALVALGPVLVVLGIAHFVTALRWHDRITPRWRDSTAYRLSATLNRWGVAGFLIFVGGASIVVGMTRLI